MPLNSKPIPTEALQRGVHRRKRDRRKIHRFLLAAVCTIPVSTGCVTYEQKPLQPEIRLARILKERAPLPSLDTANQARSDRDPVSENDPVSKKAAVRLTLSNLLGRVVHSPIAQAAAADFQAAAAVSEVPTPLPNPTVEVGPQWGFGPDASLTREVGPFGSIGVAIPLGDRRAARDAQLKARTERAQVELDAIRRRLVLDLRQGLTELGLSLERQSRLSALADTASATTAVTRQLVEAGAAAAIQVAVAEVEEERSRAAIGTAALETLSARTLLSQILGLEIAYWSRFEDVEIPVLPSDLPPLEELQLMLLDHHPDLGRRRADYEIAECTLAYEISLQIPDLQIGLPFEAETGERAYLIGLSLGMEIPLFDRNQQGIRRADSERDAARARFDAEIHARLTELERSLLELDLARSRSTVLVRERLPRAEAALELAHDSLAAGSSDARQLLDTERLYQAVWLEAVEASRDERLAWVALERAVGIPLMTFESTPESTDRRKP